VLGLTIELRRAVHSAALRAGLGGSVAIVLVLCGLVVAIEMAVRGGRPDAVTVRVVVSLFAVVAVGSAAATIFLLPGWYVRCPRILAYTSVQASSSRRSTLPTKGTAQRVGSACS
jgi:energy-converting hydrogenase Eha subunit G